MSYFDLIFFYSEEDAIPTEAIESLSKRNNYEVQMVVELVRFLLKQDYRPDQIAVLTPYLGQVVALREPLNHVVATALSERDESELRDLFELDTHVCQPANRQKAVRLVTVDNFQGEDGG
jgi:hypothetical protein